MPPNQDWVSVEDRLPPKPQRYQEFIVCCGDAVTCAWLDDDKGEWYWVTDPERLFEDVTHWMPLPERPDAV